jgi:DNA-binding transcriptional MocR family regulator
LTDAGDTLADIFALCDAAGHPDRPLMFASTSKITWPGAGVAAMVASKANIDWSLRYMTAQAIGPDKVNQLRHVRCFGSAAGVLAHMKRHAALLAPKFAAVLDIWQQQLAATGAGSGNAPRGG